MNHPLSHRVNGWRSKKQPMIARMRFLRFLAIGLELLACERTPPSAPPPHSPGPVAGACGKMPGEPVERVQWLHGKGDARCDELETRWAPRGSYRCPVPEGMLRGGVKAVMDRGYNSMITG